MGICLSFDRPLKSKSSCQPKLHTHKVLFTKMDLIPSIIGIRRWPTYQMWSKLYHLNVYNNKYWEQKAKRQIMRLQENRQKPEKTHQWLLRNGLMPKRINSNYIVFFRILVTYFDRWTTIILPFTEPVKPKNNFSILPKFKWATTKHPNPNSTMKKHCD